MHLDTRQRLGVVEFGRQLVESGDLDPLYIALYRSGMGYSQMCRWLVAYWCYYHAGLCCWVSERKDYWGAMARVVQEGTLHPRGTERRHFRGKLAVDSIERLRRQFRDATDMVDWLADAGPSAAAVMKRVKTLHGFGEWICWKVPDMLERLALAAIQFRGDDVFRMFTSSRQGAEELASRHLDPPSSLLDSHNWLVDNLGPLPAPPLYDRPINVQETETIFCKWHSHLGGHYPMGKDSYEIRLGLLKYAKCKTSQALIKGYEKGC